MDRVTAPPVRLQTEGTLATLTLQRGERANALTADMVDLMLSGVEAAQAAACTVLVIRSAERQFCGGFDLGLDTSDPTASAVLTLRFLRIGLLLERVMTSGMLTIAAVEGPAIGAGADLVAACDVRIGTERARFRFPGSAFGVVLGVSRLSQLVGPARAVQLGASGAVLDAHAASASGLLTEVVADGRLEDAVRETVDAVHRSPGVLAALKEATQQRDPAGLGSLARSLARSPDLAGSLAHYTRGSLPGPARCQHDER
ncbi:enoyl-CoA hydratase/isomerase family protein [Streptomyces sp. NPDC101249]|uniref:enoyl-CoA hydratase/isomerase family protein n=1 Tax=unclassified Streptomyces TaxID=2593676 RepID=UPI00381AAC8A